MPAERIGMRDAREIIRLKFSGVSTHEIARRLGMARSTVRETLKRADGAGLAWPLPEAMTDGPLEAARCRPLKPSPRSIGPAAPYPTGVHIPGIPPPAKFATEPSHAILDRWACFGGLYVRRSRRSPLRTAART